MISTFPPRRCGIGDYSASLCKELAKSDDVRLTVLTYEDGIPEAIGRDGNVRVIRELPRRGSRRRLKETIGRLAPDIVHLQTSSFVHHPLVNAAVAGVFEGPLVSTVHDAPDSWRTFYTIPSLHWVYGKSTRLFVHSQKVANTLEDFHNVAHDKIVKIPLGVDIAKYKPGLETAFVAKQFGLEGRMVVLFFGFLRPGKGLESLLRAWKLISRAIPQAVLVIAGGTPSYPRKYALLTRNESDYPGELKNMAVREGIANRVVFTGFVPQDWEPALFALADVVALPYDSLASQSYPLQKALSSGKAVVATGLAGFRELLEDRRNAILVPPDDVRLLAQSVESLLVDPEGAQRLGARAREFAVEHCAITATASATMSTYREICN
jgi:glycosyltransferase involved in cell wall biosynthesis